MIHELESVGNTKYVRQRETDSKDSSNDQIDDYADKVTKEITDDVKEEMGVPSVGETKYSAVKHGIESPRKALEMDQNEDLEEKNQGKIFNEIDD